MKIIKDKSLSSFFPYLIILVLGFLLIQFRMEVYGDIGLSVSNIDTPRFVEASKIDLFSVDFFTSNRPAAISLFYKIFIQDSDIEINNISNTEEGITLVKTFQAGLENVAAAQNILAIVSWTIFAVVISFQFHHPGIKVLAALLSLAFGFVPQLAEWDSVLMSESLSFSLFILVFAASLIWVGQLSKYPRGSQRVLIISSILWILVVTVWIFTRDSNAYMGWAVAALIFGALLNPKVRRALPFRLMLILAIILTAILIFHNRTLFKSDRWVNPFLNNMIVNILPHPDRVAFFEQRGMPLSDEILLLRELERHEGQFYEFESFMDWVVADGASTYTSFLIRYPTYAVAKLVELITPVVSENVQPYYSQELPPWLKDVGDALHLNNLALIFILPALILIVSLQALKAELLNELAFAFILVFFFAGSLIMYFISVHGDGISVVRHSLVAVMPWRLLFWLALIKILDNAVSSFNVDWGWTRLKIAELFR